jgi:hypothetical protein
VKMRALSPMVQAHEVQGADPGLRTALEHRGLGYAPAAAESHRVATAAGQVRADALAARLPPRAWQRPSAGAGAKGHRFYDWAWVAIAPGRPRLSLAADPPQPARR